MLIKRPLRTQLRLSTSYVTVYKRERLAVSHEAVSIEIFHKFLGFIIAIGALYYVQNARITLIGPFVTGAQNG